MILGAIWSGLKIIGRVGKVRKAIAETMDVYREVMDAFSKGQALYGRYDNLPDDVKAYFGELRDVEKEVREAWVAIKNIA